MSSVHFAELYQDASNVNLKIALFGMSANPPTGIQGHMGIVRYLVQCGVFNEVWILPVYHHIFKKSNLVEFHHRVNMCKLSMEVESTKDCIVRVLPLEELCYKHYCAQYGERFRVGTIDVLDFIKLVYPKLEIHLILGSDTYADLQHKKWKESDRLLTEGTIHVFSRRIDDSEFGKDHSYIFPDPILKNVYHHKVHTLGSVSSTKVRAMLPALFDIWPLNSTDLLKQTVHPAVYRYLKAHRLFHFDSEYFSRRIQWEVLGLSAVFVTLHSVVARFKR